MGFEVSGPERADSTMVFRGRFEKWLTVEWFWESICEIESPGQGFLATHAQNDVYMTLRTVITPTCNHMHPPPLHPTHPGSASYPSDATCRPC